MKYTDNNITTRKYGIIIKLESKGRKQTNKASTFMCIIYISIEIFPIMENNLEQGSILRDSTTINTVNRTHEISPMAGKIDFRNNRSVKVNKTNDMTSTKMYLL